MPNESKFMTPADLGYYDDKIKGYVNHEMDKQKHKASDITSGTFSTERLPVMPIAKGGTDADTANAAQFNLLGGMMYLDGDLTDDSDVVMAYKTPTAEEGVTYRVKAKRLWNYINAKIKDGFGFNATGVLDVAHGGTASTNAAGARNALGAAAASHAHTADNITSGVLDVARIPVDSALSATSANPVQNKAVQNALSSKQDKLVAGDNITIDPDTNVISATGTSGEPSGVLDIAHGGTSSTNAAGARNALGAAAASHTHKASDIASGVLDAARIPSHKHAASDIASGVLDAARIPVDSALSATSVKPVQNKVVQAALAGKQDKLVAGDNITIDPDTNEISAAGAGDLQRYRRSLRVETEITNGEDLNAYQLTGNYGCSVADVSTIMNKPSGLSDPFLLFVQSIGGSALQEIVDSKGSRWSRTGIQEWNQTYDSLQTIPVKNGGTGATSLTSNAVLLGNGTDAVNHAAPSSGALYATSEMSKPTFGTLPIAQGGTGAVSASDARKSLGITPDNIGIKSWLLNSVFKVGYVWVSYTSTSPASIIGGSWTAITGRFPYFNAGTSIGGSNSHTLTADQLANHRHQIGLDQDAYYTANADSGYSVHKSAEYYSDSGNSTWAWSGGLGDISGTWASGHGHNNMPAYQTLYAWRRVS